MLFCSEKEVDVALSYDIYSVWLVVFHSLCNYNAAGPWAHVAFFSHIVLFIKYEAPEYISHLQIRVDVIYDSQ